MESDPEPGQDTERDQSLGWLLRTCRYDAGLTQEELARRSGLSVRAISDLERGCTTRPFMRSVRLLADAMMLADARRQQLLRAARHDASLSDGPGGRERPRPASPGRADPRVPDQLRPWRVVPRQLPAAVRHFAGRTRELAQLNEGADEIGQPGRAMVISVIGGTPGVGKTALAVHWAYQLASRFPDGQLYVDLQGFSPDHVPVTAQDALGGFLAACGVPPAERPARPNEQAALFRSLLADRAVLVVLDNARDAEHVRLLLPGSPTCMVIVSSRNELAGLAITHGAHLLTLDVLGTAEAVELLASRISPERIAAEKAAVIKLIELCAGLPLALSIAAARVAAQPGIPLTLLAAELSNMPERLDALETGDVASDMRAVLSWSCQTVSGAAAQMFRLVGLHPGPDISVRAAASLIGRPVEAARRLLAELARAGLLREYLMGRYTCHDLLRAYAAELVLDGDDQARTLEPPRAVNGGRASAERHAATYRVLDYYLHAAHSAAGLLLPSRSPLSLPPAQPGVAAENFTDRRQALAWMEAERRVLLAVTARAALLGFDSHAWQLPWALTSFLGLEGHWDDWAAVERSALKAADRLGDQLGQAHAWSGIGCACLQLGSYAEARASLRRAAGLFGQLGDLAALTRCYLNVGHTFERQGRYEEALSHAGQALDLAEASGDQPGQASARNAVGWCYLRLGNYAEAETACREALRLNRLIGDRLGEAGALDSLGYAQHHLGQRTEAIACLTRAVELSRDLGNRLSESDSLLHLGDVYEADGQRGAARQAWRQALVILSRLCHPDAQEARRRLHGSATATAQ